MTMSPEKTADIVDSAVVADAFTTLAAALTAAGLVDTLQGPGDQVALADATGQRANLVITDVVASNGVIHAIDAVLLPTA